VNIVSTYLNVELYSFLVLLTWEVNYQNWMEQDIEATYGFSYSHSFKYLELMMKLRLLLGTGCDEMRCEIGSPPGYVVLFSIGTRSGYSLLPALRILK
jgi:hypothetical protein